MEITALELSQMLNGTLEGNPEVVVSKPAKIEEGMPGDVCFLSNEKYLRYAYITNASILIVDESLVLEEEIKPTIIRVKNAYSSFSQILEAYQKGLQKSGGTGIDQQAYIHPTATIGSNTYIGPFCYIGKNAVVGNDVYVSPGAYVGDDVSIGNGTLLQPGVRVLQGCVVGERCIINAGTVIGSEGFGFAPQEDGTFKKVPQTGNVVIGNDVEIGANTTIDRATMGSTTIRNGVKLDNLIQIAHNVDIGENTVIAAQTGISGSTKIGKNCMIGGQVGIVGHIEIADGTRINAQSGVAKTIRQQGVAVTGSPAFDYSEAMRAQVVYKKLPELYQRLNALELKLKDIESAK
jgi:UDP-3-O-[3-hydroxymyristoyl] glucosamine N-acyltransferase